MKKILILFAWLLLLTPAFAATPVAPSSAPIKASSIKFQVGPNKQWVSLEDIAYMKPRDFAAITQRHMNFIRRTEFLVAQRKLRKSINADGTLNNKKLEKMMAPVLDGDTGFHIGGFALGFLLGLIGILIAYLINDDNKSNRRKWAWIGFGIFLVIYIALIAALAGA